MWRSNYYRSSSISCVEFSLALAILFGAIAPKTYTIVAQTIINVPPNPAPPSISGDTVLNVTTGGTLPFLFDALSGSVVNIDGGSVSFGFGAEDGSTVNVLTGQIGRGFTAHEGSTVNIAGGTFAGAVRSREGSTININGGNFGEDFKASGTITFYGDEFFVDGAPLEGLEAIGDSVTFELPIQSQIMGVLADGTPFSFSYLDDDLFQNASISLVRKALPPINDYFIDLTTDSVPKGVRNGQTLVVKESGVIGDDFHAATGSTVVIQSGNVGDNFEVAGSMVDVVGGTIGSDFGAFSGSIVNLFGGSVGRNMTPLPGSMVNIQGGQVESVYVSGESKINISGGTITRDFTARSGAEVIIRGDDFRVNGAPVEGLGDFGNSQAIELTLPFVLSGTLSSGTPFAFASKDHDTFEEGTLTLVQTVTPPINEEIISLPESPSPNGIRNGQTLVVGLGGVLNDSFSAGRGSTITISGGTIGNNVEAVGTVINLLEGQIGANFDAFEGTTVTVEGGIIGESFYVGENSSLSVLDGQVGVGLLAASGAAVNIAGGAVASLRLQHGAKSTISGGLLDLVASPGASVELVGRKFLLDDASIPGLNSPGDSIVLMNRNGEVLRTILDDGSVNEFVLRGPSRSVVGHFASGSTLRLTLAVPEPSGLLLLILGAFLASSNLRRRE